MAERFPEGFLWGCATSAYQIEGAAAEEGKGDSIWDRFAHTPGKISTGDTGDVACDHYHRWPEDLALMTELGVGAYRLSISWPRVLPRGWGEVNQAGVDFYSRLVDGLLEREIEPWVTLFHWDLPQALEERGGWPRRDTAEAFGEYAWLLYERLGDRVERWITINEPICIAVLGYLEGIFAPGRRSLRAALAAGHTVNLAHGRAVQAFRESGREGEIGITINVTPQHPASEREEDEQAARLADAWSNRWYLDPVLKGEYPREIEERLAEDLPERESGDLELISQPLDFLGLNYYFRQMVSHVPGEGPLDFRVEHGPGEKTAFGWEVYPEGFGETMRRMREEYSVEKLFITENGAAYEDRIGEDGQVQDPERVRFLERHLREVHRAIEAGVPVGGYFLWSLLDNFEWASGFSMRFGIHYTDFETRERLPKESARWYARVIADNALR